MYARAIGLALFLSVFALGCRPRTAETARRDFCETAWTSVELIPPGVEPTRPYTIVSAVDAVILPTPARRAKKMQFKACMLHADAVLDRSTPSVTYEEKETVGPWGTVTTTRTAKESSTWTPGQGYAIRWVNAPAAATGQPLVASP